MLFFDSVDFSFLCVVFSFLRRNGEVWEDGEKYKERNPQMGHRVSLCIRVLRFGFSMLFLDMVSSFKTSETSPRLLCSQVLNMSAFLVRRGWPTLLTEDSLSIQCLRLKYRITIPELRLQFLVKASIAEAESFIKSVMLAKPGQTLRYVFSLSMSEWCVNIWKGIFFFFA